MSELRNITVEQLLNRKHDTIILHEPEQGILTFLNEEYKKLKIPVCELRCPLLQLEDFDHGIVPAKIVTSHVVIMSDLDCVPVSDQRLMYDKTKSYHTNVIVFITATDVTELSDYFKMDKFKIKM